MSGKKTILITGGTGFAGSHLAQAISHAFDPEQLSLHLTHIAPVPEEPKQLVPNATFHQVDLTDREQVDAVFETVMPDEVYQLASIAMVGNSHSTTETILQANTAIICHVLDAMREKSPSAKMVVISSAEVYGKSMPEELPISENHQLRPSNPYGVSKMTQDALARVYVESYGLHIVIARPFNHIGERQEPGFVVSDFAKQVVAIEQGKSAALKVGNLDAQRDFTDVKDIVQGYMTLMENGVPGEAYNLGSGTSHSMSDVVAILQELSNVTWDIEQDTSRLRPADIPIMVADSTKARALGWYPQSTMKDAVARTLSYWRKKS